ncbi:metallophosphoesterase [Hymenobacter latericus]|uniref:metallophosphoesterase n=1 Tax=Hymenobacter sp. YIM 151858-1 TaxID=2987688 RepID=UPI0022275B9A|nr:metallophosphoesterase [Hymenobacter sp. YIM 151858-1]UYZ59923.1 metallophosphoesterase [Hymenobacter sp. YIM 151858-1]
MDDAHALRPLCRGTGLALLLWVITSPISCGQRFACIGDYGFEGPNLQQVAGLIKTWNPEFIITTGDNNYDFGAKETIDRNIGQYFHDYIYPYSGTYGAASPKAENRFFPSIGNHDVYTESGKPYRDFFSLPGNERYYEFTRGNLHFFVVNSDPSEPDGTSSSSVQAQWLKQQLAASNKPWKVVYFHHAPYSSGHYGNIEYMQWPFKAWGASLVMAGHNHHYERLTVDGLTYIVNGLGGRSLYGIGAKKSFTQALYAGDYGAMLLEASANTLSMKFITRTGIEIDAATLVRVGAPLPVTLTAFQATRRGSEAVLAWSTANELRNRGFGIEVSTDGTAYRTLAFVPATGRTTQQPQHYTYRDTEPNKSDMRYYRLRQEDEDGKQNYFGPVPVRFDPMAVALSTYPNPFEEELTLEILAETTAAATITLTDNLGRVVWQAARAVQPGANRVQLVPGLSKGLYQATVLLNGKVLSQRLVKQ